MPLRRPPVLTPRALAARRANALKSTGPRTAAGKARSCLNALRHGRRARDLRGKIARTGDSEALFLLDWFHDHILQFWQPRNERMWHYTIRLAGRVWCFMNGRTLRPGTSQPLPASPDKGGDFPGRLDQTGERTGGLKRPVNLYRYGATWCCPRGLRIAYKRGPGIQFTNPNPARRRHILMGWLPEFRYLPGPPPKAIRVRRSTGDVESSRGAGALDRWLENSKPAKNQVRTKLECSKESALCADLWQTPVGAAIEPLPAEFRDLTEADRSRHPVSALLPRDLGFAADETFAFRGPGDEKDEVPDGLHPLIALQWAKWRQARADIGRKGVAETPKSATTQAQQTDPSMNAPAGAQSPPGARKDIYAACLFSVEGQAGPPQEI
jgi:hypothetical protein